MKPIATSTILVGIYVALAWTVAPAKAQADDPALVACKVITDRAAEHVRLGETARARRLKPQLQQCLPIQRAALDRAARRVVTDARGRN